MTNKDHDEPHQRQGYNSLDRQKSEALLGVVKIFGSIIGVLVMLVGVVLGYLGETTLNTVSNLSASMAGFAATQAAQEKHLDYDDSRLDAMTGRRPPRGYQESAPKSGMGE
jgi:hypothetical protein